MAEVKVATTEMRIQALAQLLDVENGTITATEYQPWYGTGDNPIQFDGDGGEYLVLTDEEADRVASISILDTVWATRTSFLMDHINFGDDDMSPGEVKATEKALEKIQGELCESCNSLLKAMLRDKEEFVKAIVDADGRGPTLAGYDHNEEEEMVDGVCFAIYRTN